MIDDETNERDDFIHLVDMSSDLYTELGLEIVKLSGEHDVCPQCATLLLHDLAERMRESWHTVAPDYSQCKH